MSRPGEGLFAKSHSTVEMGPECFLRGGSILHVLSVRNSGMKALHHTSMWSADQQHHPPPRGCLLENQNLGPPSPTEPKSHFDKIPLQVIPVHPGQEVMGQVTCRERPQPDKAGTENLSEKADTRAAKDSRLATKWRAEWLSAAKRPEHGGQNR